MLGVPVKVLHEAEGHVVTVETATGELYRGVLIEAEDNMNMQVILKKKYFSKSPPKRKICFFGDLEILKKIV